MAFARWIETLGLGFAIGSCIVLLVAALGFPVVLPNMPGAILAIIGGITTIKIMIAGRAG